ncbi:complement C1q-like protein 2 [Ruditapes philippinarum]|uniref:complement C1q-like protein 2 n=1 Tax=Ruditapes philippinarum TaxID=129788 RepID=UPI00295B1B44|nr:complement C1q-like protein 2 [Ruditapes philippinarum]
MFIKLLFSLLTCLLFRVEGKISTLEECLVKFDKVEERLQTLESETKVTKRLSMLPDGEGSKVAFYTQLSKDANRVGDHQTIVFDTVTTNVGNGYNPVDGIFTAPVDGIYVFFWLNTNRDRSYMNTELVRDAVVVGKSMSDAMDHDDYAAASNSAVLQLKTGIQ